MSFLLVRLLQGFSSFTHYPELREPKYAIPKEWKNASGRKGIDNFFPKLTITMYSGVIISFQLCTCMSWLLYTGGVIVGGSLDQGSGKRDGLIFWSSMKCIHWRYLCSWAVSYMHLNIVSSKSNSINYTTKTDTDYSECTTIHERDVRSVIPNFGFRNQHHKLECWRLVAFFPLLAFPDHGDHHRSIKDKMIRHMGSYEST